MPCFKVRGKLCRVVFARHIRKNGKTIYPKKSKVFKFFVPID